LCPEEEEEEYFAANGNVCACLGAQEGCSGWTAVQSQRNRVDWGRGNDGCIRKPELALTTGKHASKTTSSSSLCAVLAAFGFSVNDLGRVPLFAVQFKVTTPLLFFFH
jgi:hypothetical protein